MSNVKSITKNSIYNILYQALNIVFPLITSVYVSRIIMEDGVGKVAYAQNIVSYFLSFAALGLPVYGVREIGKIKDNQTTLDEVYSELFIINAISTTIAILAYIGLISLTPAFKTHLDLYICTGLLIVLNYANIDWLYKGIEEYGYITKRSIAVKLLSLISLFVFVRSKNDYINYALITSAGCACNYIFNLYYSRKFVHFKINCKTIKTHIKPLIVLTITIFFGNVYNKIDTTMLGSLCDYSTVGYYNNAHKIILIGVTCCQSISAVLLPRLSYYFHSDPTALEKLIDKGLKALLSITIPAFAGTILLAEEAIIFLYGQSFASAGKTLAIFAPMLIIRPIGDLLCYQLLISVGEERKRLVSSIIATIINIAFNILLIPSLGQNGAAIASVISEIIVNGYLLRYALKYVRIHIELSFLTKTVIGTCIMACSIYALKLLINSSIVYLLISITGGIVVYIIASICLKNVVIEMLLTSSISTLKKMFFRK